MNSSVENVETKLKAEMELTKTELLETFATKDLVEKFRKNLEEAHMEFSNGLNLQKLETRIDLMASKISKNAVAVNPNVCEIFFRFCLWMFVGHVSE